MGRGQSSSRKRSSGTGTRFTDVQQLDDYITSNGAHADRLFNAFSDAYGEESNDTRSMERNIRESVDVDGWDEMTEAALNSEQRQAEKGLKALPKQKTAAQLGTEEGLKDRLERIKELKKLKGTRGRGASNTSEVATYRTRR